MDDDLTKLLQTFTQTPLTSTTVTNLVATTSDCESIEQLIVAHIIGFLNQTTLTSQQVTLLNTLLGYWANHIKKGTV